MGGTTFASSRAARLSRSSDSSDAWRSRAARPRSSYRRWRRSTTSVWASASINAVSVFGRIEIHSGRTASGPSSPVPVTLDDGTRLPGTLVGADPIFDLAVVRIPPPSAGTLPTVALGDSDRARVGEEVVAIGNPLGLDQTLTRGVISGINRILPETPFSALEPLLQTDAAINPGNSGGPLVNRCGEVIGINTAVITDAQNIGFAVPANLAKATLPALVTHGRVVRPWVGFHGQMVGSELRSLLNVPLVEGLLVEVIEPQSPAEKAGLRGGRQELELDGRAFLLGGDIVTRINGRPIDSSAALAEAMRTLRVGGELEVRVFREGSYRDVRYSLPERPLLPGDVPADRAPSTPTGMRVRRAVHP